MLAGLVLFSTTIGFVAALAMMAFSLPAWVTLAAYPAACSITLLLSAAVWSMHSGHGDSRERLAPLQPHA